MEIIGIKDLEKCFDGAKNKELLFAAPIDKQFIDYLSAGGVMKYYANLALPFYKIDYYGGKLIIRGIEGAKTLKITVKAQNDAQLVGEILDLIEKYSR